MTPDITIPVGTQRSPHYCRALTKRNHRLELAVVIPPCPLAPHTKQCLGGASVVTPRPG